jgi:hypothetical protein
LSISGGDFASKQLGAGLVLRDDKLKKRALWTMKTIEQIIQVIERSWQKPASTIKTEEPFRLACSIYRRQNDFINPFSFILPNDLLMWWNIIERAKLFEDVDFGQWGLQIFSELEAFDISEKYRLEDSDYKDTDIIIGSFLGDSDLLLISTDTIDFGSIIVALSMDKRTDWYKVSSSFEDFLSQYVLNEGDKFWEKDLK